jgi:plastocyanin
MQEDPMLHSRPATMLLAGATLSAALAGCGSSSAGSSGVQATGSNGPTVTIQGFAFHPSTLTVSPGTKVTFINEDSVQHTATGSAGSSFIASGTLNKGQSYTVTFTKAGTYSYICTIHPNMHGEVIVK